MVAQGSFRQDLYYRLNVMRIELPALAERPGDILLLAQTFIDRINRRSGRRIEGVTPQAAQLLCDYDWPGNVRELQNVIERAAILTAGEMITAESLSGLGGDESGSTGQELVPLSEVERRHIRFCLDRMDWNLAATAEVLGVHRNTLRTKIREYKLSRG